MLPLVTEGARASIRMIRRTARKVSRRHEGNWYSFTVVGWVFYYYLTTGLAEEACLP